MKKTILFTLLASSLFGSSGEAIFKEKCISCHLLKKGWQIEMKSELLAPTAFGVAKNLRGIFSSKEQFRNFVVDYLNEPQRIKVRCKEEVVKKFGLMPSMKDVLSDDEKRIVADYLFDLI